jgi:heme/copper-type cytochrome/quinol oxidase subunit 1
MGEHTSGERKPRKPGRLSAAVLPVVGIVAVLVGCLVAWSNANAGIGWFAYAPLSNQLFAGNGVAFVSQGTQIGVAVAVAGLLVLAFWAGYRIGRRASPKSR